MPKPNNLRRLITRMLAFASLLQYSEDALTICITSPSDSNAYAEARNLMCIALANEYIKTNGGSARVIRAFPETCKHDDGNYSDQSTDNNPDIAYAELDYEELLTRPRKHPLLDRSYSNNSLSIVDAGSVESGAPLVWKDYAHVIALVLDSESMTNIALQRLRKEIDRLGIRIDGSVLLNFPFHIPQYLYDRL